MSAVPATTPTSKKSMKSPYRRMKDRGGQAKGVDLVTGKATVEYYFDPSLVISGGDGSDYSKAPKKQKDVNQFFASKHLYMPCTIIKPLDEKAAKSTTRALTDPFDGPTLVKTADGTLHKISQSTGLIALKTPEDYIGIDDVLHLPEISEASLLHALKQRYKREEIYTAAGPILISVNPYKSLVVGNEGESIYSENQMLHYRTNQGAFEEKGPHLFEIADRAYSALLDSVRNNFNAHPEDEDPVLLMDEHAPGSARNQSIIISGESGAGKTEATKIIMKFLARITRKSDQSSYTSPNGKRIAALEDRVLSSNPLLETFGNAQTLRNDNSSRFGKFIHINFDLSKGFITGASIYNYLLEKTRITTQVEGERNYHIFYQLFSSGDENLIQELGLKSGTGGFQYLGRRPNGASEKDAKALGETIECLGNLGLGEDEQRAVFSIAAAVLHLGNIEFEEDQGSDNAKISKSSFDSLKLVCQLLGLDEANLTEAILTKRLVVNGKTIKKAQNIALATDKRDSLAMLTYSNLFIWLVRKVNETLHDQSDTTKNNDKGFIGVLDIYGFESFEVNGFEQLLINYCNEKLQRHFNRHLFEVEQELYSNEGVDWSYITFNDNRPCLELIEGGNGVVGILNYLDDSWGGMGTSSEKDVKFVAQLHKQFGNIKGASDGKDNPSSGFHENFVTPKFGKDNQFIIIHFAGEVRYTADGFVEKNMDTLSNELKELGENSTLSIPRSVYMSSTQDQSTPLRSSIRGISVGSQFRSSLQELVGDLDRTQPHYIRCIKPNLMKVPGSFLPGEVLKQLRYSGMMEAIRIRREGYALREDHESFYKRFSVLLHSEDDAEGEAGIENLVRVLSKRLHVTDADWQIGHTKIFLRHELADKLERMTDLRVRTAARTLCRFTEKVVHTRLSKLLVAWVRFRLKMLKHYREAKAASLVAAWVRRCKESSKYKKLQSAFIRIQAHRRRQLATQRVRKIRDPYCDMSFNDCKELLASEQIRLQEAVKSKKFRQAADLEKKIAALEKAVEAKRPITRELLDSRINDLNAKLEDAVNRKAYTECGPLQEQLDELIAKREELPTEDELRAKVAAANEKVTIAANNKDFSTAAEAQAELDAAQQRLRDFLADSQKELNDEATVDLMGFKSRAQLEVEIKSLSNQVQDAISAKNFSKASALQESIHEREGLRKFFPTVEEIVGQLESAKKELDLAISKKDFATADNLNRLIAELEEKLDAEKRKTADLNGADSKGSQGSLISVRGKEITSRGELETCIRELSEEVSKAVEVKNFKKADDSQRDLDELTKLRDKFPSVPELETKLRTKKADLDKAIANKKFSVADVLQVEIEALETKLKNERRHFPPQAKDDISVKSAPVVPKVNVASDTSIKSAPVVPKGPSVSGARSVYSTPGKSQVTPKKPVAEVRSPGSSSKTVQNLRPAKPLTSLDTESILDVVHMLASKRCNAGILLRQDGSLSGILTDTDVTRRVVAKDVDPATTSVSEVMTPNPTCVSISDSATDALATMVENHFRHLPVVDDSGAVVGLLDIAKCLNDAIDRLEKSALKSENAAEDAVKQMISQQGASAAHAAALQALLGNLMAKAFGNSTMPTLRNIVAGQPRIIVTTQTTIRDAGAVMAEHRKACLVVDGHKLVGIFGFKDMMSRAIAKGLPLDSTPVTAVMTSNPEVASPDITVLEALQIMHDGRFLSLPVCESSGTVVGVVDVMDLIQGCGGTEGWRSLFGSMDTDDDMSDMSSVGSASRKSQGNTTASKKSVGSASARKPSKKGPMSLSDGLAAVDEIDELPVSKLRPKAAIISSSGDTVLKVTQLLQSKRGRASIVVGPQGTLVGILTDKDIVCRVVGKGFDASSVAVDEVMTPDPICVSTNDSALESLTTMVEKRIRHLPVVDEARAIVGVLDVSKCINNALSRLERAEENQSNAMESAVNSVVGQQAGDKAAALKSLLENLLSMGTTTTSLRNIITVKPKTIVGPSTSVAEAGQLMAEHRKAALIVDRSGMLVGIFGFKDLVTRVLAKELPLEATPLESVMTNNPESVSPDTSIMEALQIMHDNKFLTLPVCESNGNVVGLVDVLDLLHGCGGAEGWRKIFQSSMDLGVDDDESVASGSASIARSLSSGRTNESKRKREMKQVLKLRPARPVLALTTESVLAVAQSLQKKRSAAALVVSPEGSLSGILTDVDFTRKVIAKDIDPTDTPVSIVMTPDPYCVKATDQALDALMTMVEKHVRHLPVLDGEGSVIGILDIAKCLNDAIEKLERSQKSSSSTAEDVVMQVVKQQGGSSEQTAALNALLGTLMAQAFGAAVPTLRKIIGGKAKTIIPPHLTVREAGYIMAENGKASLIVENGELIGIFGFKDMMTRVIAKELSLDDTEVQDVMTSSPETVTPDITALEALQMMHDNNFLTLPVCEHDGTVLGVVDVMDVMYGCGGPEGWRSMFEKSMQMDDLSETASVTSRSRSGGRSRQHETLARATVETPMMALPEARLPANIPMTLEFEDGDHTISRSQANHDELSGSIDMMIGSFKISDPNGATHRVKCVCKADELISLAAEKVGINRHCLRLGYTDEDGDFVNITTDDDVVEAWHGAKKSGAKIAKLTALATGPQKDEELPPAVILGVGLAVIGAAAFLLLRPRS
ncbi:hypothetical protein ACA910_005291 [Epithemia clementina (nom. ined.)]